MSSFEFTAKEAHGAVYDYYHKKWFGTSPEYINIGESKPKFLPFYACDGKVLGNFTAEVKKTQHYTDSNGKSHTRSYYQYVGAFELVHRFQPNSTTVYAGFKYNRKHVAHICNDAVLTSLHPPRSEDLDGAKIHLFELSTTQVKSEIVDALSAELDATAKAEVRKYMGIFHSASELRIHWTQRSVKLKTLQPLYCPTFVVPLHYDEIKFKCFVSGVTANVTGPYIVNAQLLSRVAAVTAYGAALMLIPNKLIALAGGLAAAAAASFTADWMARRAPRWARDWEKSRREKRKNAGKDETAIPVNPFLSSPFETSSFRFGQSSSESGRQQEAFDEDDPMTSKGTNQTRATSRLPADPCGYYKVLKLTGRESKEEIQTQYRRLMLQYHPDTSGDASTANVSRVAKLNEAYRVVRDPRRRAEYDQRLV